MPCLSLVLFVLSVVSASSAAATATSSSSLCCLAVARVRLAVPVPAPVPFAATLSFPLAGPSLLANLAARSSPPLNSGEIGRACLDASLAWTREGGGAGKSLARSKGDEGEVRVYDGLILWADGGGEGSVGDDTRRDGRAIQVLLKWSPSPLLIQQMTTGRWRRGDPPLSA